MPSTVTKYNKILASPSDLKEDRLSRDEVIKELNISYGRQNDILVEALKWETHSAPGISTIHPQKLSNADLGTVYDLFIGLIWKKFGTPTDSAESGTEEEFLNAYDSIYKTTKLITESYFISKTPQFLWVKFFRTNEKNSRI